MFNNTTNMYIKKTNGYVYLKMLNNKKQKTCCKRQAGSIIY